MTIHTNYFRKLLYFNGSILDFIEKTKSGTSQDQNRTDTSSLEGYGSTIELQALKVTPDVVTQIEYFFQEVSIL